MVNTKKKQIAITLGVELLFIYLFILMMGDIVREFLICVSLVRSARFHSFSFHSESKIHSDHRHVSNTNWKVTGTTNDFILNSKSQLKWYIYIINWAVCMLSVASYHTHKTEFRSVSLTLCGQSRSKHVVCGIHAFEIHRRTGTHLCSGDCGARERQRERESDRLCLCECVYSCMCIWAWVYAC